MTLTVPTRRVRVAPTMISSPCLKAGRPAAWPRALEPTTPSTMPTSTLTSSMIKDSGNGHDDGDGAYEKPVALTPHKGAVYTVAGSSGHTSGGSLNHPGMYISLNVVGSLVLDIDGSRLDAKFLNSSGSVKDYFTIKKDLGTSTFDFSLTNGGSKSVSQ